MYKRSIFFIAVATVVILTACAPLVSSGSQGEILVYLGGDSSSRALSDPPFEELPVFSFFTIRVSGPGMEPVEFTVDGTQSSFTAMVPGGSERVVELYAPVDWDATYDALLKKYPTNMPSLPTLVKAYGATVTVDVVPGQRVTAVLRLEVAETKILLPDPNNNGLLSIANSPTDPGPYDSAIIGSTDSFFAFDRFGRVLVSGVSPILAYNDLLNPISGQSIEMWATSIAIDKQRNILYLIGDGSLESADLTSYPIAIASVISPSGYNLQSRGLAADSTGNLYVYTSRTIGQTTEYGILKFSSSNPELFTFATDNTLGLVYEKYDGVSSYSPYSLGVRDMTVKDGKLYVLAGENYDYSYTDYELYPSHGKLVEIDTVTMTKVRELGWTPGNPTDPAHQFYGPQRFIALAPRKLIFADEGYIGITDTDVDRVVEVNLDSWNISGIGLENVSSFFMFYSYFVGGPS